jgi:hypothetical protein
MSFLSYTWHKKTFPEIDELQCDTDYRKSRKEVWHIPEPCDMFVLYQPAKEILGRCLSHFKIFQLLYHMVKQMCYQHKYYWKKRYNSRCLFCIEISTRYYAWYICLLTINTMFSEWLIIQTKCTYHKELNWVFSIKTYQPNVKYYHTRSV